MTVKKLFGLLHLWLGLASGLVIFVVCVTAAIWAFSPELESFTQRYRHVEKQEKPILSVATLKEIAVSQLPGKQLQRLNFEGAEKAAVADFYGEGYYYAVYINPYDGKVLKVSDEEHTFFRKVIEGHYSLWLGEVGGQIVKWATLIFLIMLITGIVLWWPRNKAARKQRFKIKMGTSPKRLNYDLHNVLGFYASWIVLFAALTGLVWMFDGLRKAEFWMASGGKEMPAYPDPLSVKPAQYIAQPKGIDSIYQLQLGKYKKGVHASAVQFANNDSASIQISVYPNERYYDGDFSYFDQYTFKEMPVNFFGKYADANGGEKLSRMNYDIHIGSILGLPGRIAMFLAVLIGASLPITGFYIWWGRKKKGKKKTVKQNSKEIINHYFEEKKKTKAL